MIRMYKSNSKRGFTLVEMLLAIAIMMLTASCFFSLMLVVMKSHTNVAIINDVADYAMLNARAFENTIINSSKIGSGSNEISVKNDCLALNGKPLFDLEQYKTVPGNNNKWKMTFTCSITTSGVVNYQIELEDTAQLVDGLVHPTYTYEGSVYVPHLTGDGAITPTNGTNVFMFED